MTNHPSLFPSASWIWSARPAPAPHQYICFRQSFRIPRRIPARLFLSVDSDFIAWLNGVEVGRGQFSDWPRRKTYTTLDVGHALRAGRNVLAVLAYYRGEDFVDHRAGQAGLIASLHAGDTLVAATDATWKTAPHPAFRPGPMPRVTQQMGFTTAFDARRDQPWQEPAFRDTTWQPARVLAGPTDGFWQELLPRPVPPWRLEPPVAVTVVAQGDFHRRGEATSTAATMSQDALVSRRHWEPFVPPPRMPRGYTPRTPTPTDALRDPGGRGLVIKPPERGSTGRFLTVDLGREEAGLLTFRLDAPAGTVVDIAHGEHLDDGRVRAAVGRRNFADRYIARGGRQEFTLPFRRLGARYLELHVSRFRRPVRLEYLGLRPAVLPVAEPAAFRCSDQFAEKTDAIARRTLRLCMHEHFEDCPWREQGLYAYDSRNQALYGYYAFGNYDFAAASFDLLGHGTRPDGLLELTAPGGFHFSFDKNRLFPTIPLFTLAWIIDLAELWLHGGQPDLFRQFRPQIERILAVVAERFDPRTGLYRLIARRGLWQFYDWEDGLAGPLLGCRAERRRFDAPHNLFVHETLGAYAWMLGQAGDTRAAATVRCQQQSLGCAIHRQFWDPRRGHYHSFLLDGRRYHQAAFTQLLAVHAGLFPRPAVPALLSKLAAPDLVPLTFGSRLYHVLALMPQGPAARAAVADDLRTAWGRMVLAGATSFWETPTGADDFDDAGSLCHGWSALPVYYHHAWVLGVRPLEPGFRRFLINPYPDQFAHAAGEIPTPAGAIRIKWERTPRGLVVEARGPRRLTPVARAWPEAPIARLTYNGTRLQLAHT